MASHGLRVTVLTSGATTVPRIPGVRELALERSGFSKMVMAILPPGKKQRWNRTFGLPKIREVWHAMRQLSPDLVICRDFNLQSVAILILSTQLKIATGLLTQTPIEELRKLRDRGFIKSFFLARSGRRYAFLPRKVTLISPVISRQTQSASPHKVDNAISKSNIHFWPFVVYPSGHAVDLRKENPFRVVAIGKYRRYKGFETLIQALYRAASKVEPFSIQLTIIAEASRDEDFAYQRKLVALSERLGIRDLVSFRTNLPREEVRRHLQTSHVFVLSSPREVASYAVLEAAAEGTAPIVPLENGTNGYLVEGVSAVSYLPNNVDSLTSTLLKVHGNRVLTNRVGYFAMAETSRLCNESIFFSQFRHTLRALKID